MNNDIHKCKYCGTEIDYNCGDEHKGNIWSCENCGDWFCTDCYLEKLSDEAFEDIEETLCYECAIEKVKQDEKFDF